MKIKINEETYDVPLDEELVLLRAFQKMLLAEYEKLDQKWRLLGKPVSREILRKMETTTREKHGNEKAMMLRPPKQVDPTIFLSSVMLSILQEAMKHVEFSISTEEYTVTNLNLSVKNKAEAGRQVAIDGDERLR